MTLTQKRRRAAVIAVSCYTQMENITSESPNDIWGKMGISRIVSGRELLQRKGKAPGTRSF
ncbi:hypothetical protein [Lutibacter sp.]|uniref:hypothetical protein n=1 Tax=Lutibacter sp. TaxID=1925666 RepID=UPI003566915D